MKWHGLSPRHLEHVAVAAREVPDVARLEVVGLGAALRVDDGGAHAAFDDERPLGGRGVPVQLAHHARLEAHRDAGDALGDRQLLDGRLLAVAAADRPCPSDFSSSNLNVGSSLPDEDGIGDVVLETVVTAFGTDGGRGPKHRKPPARTNFRAANIPSDSRSAATAEATPREVEERLVVRSRAAIATRG